MFAYWSMRRFACALYVGMLLLAPIAGCDVVIPVFDCVIDLRGPYWW